MITAHMERCIGQAQLNGSVEVSTFNDFKQNGESGSSPIDAPSNIKLATKIYKLIGRLNAVNIFADRKSTMICDNLRFIPIYLQPSPKSKHIWPRFNTRSKAKQMSSVQLMGIVH